MRFVFYTHKLHSVLPCLKDKTKIVSFMLANYSKVYILLRSLDEGLYKNFNNNNQIFSFLLNQQKKLEIAKDGNWWYL